MSTWNAGQAEEYEVVSRGEKNVDFFSLAEMSSSLCLVCKYVLGTYFDGEIL